MKPMVCGAILNNSQITAIEGAGAKGLSNQICKSYVTHGFNDNVKEFYTATRNAYVVWRAAGKPRDYQTRDYMNVMRPRFRHALKQCKLIDDTARTDSIAKNHFNVAIVRIF